VVDADSGALTRPLFGALVFWFFGFGSFGLAGRLRREESGVC
jgi:hypothetical protein